MYKDLSYVRSSLIFHSLILPFFIPGFNRTSGRGDYAASPDELGTGPHTLDITCMDDDAYASSESIKFNLAEPPLVPPRMFIHTAHITHSLRHSHNLYSY